MKKKIFACNFLILCLVFFFANGFALSAEAASAGECTKMQISDFVGDYTLEDTYVDHLFENTPCGNCCFKLISVKLSISEDAKISMFYEILDDSTVPENKFSYRINTDCNVEQKIDSSTGEKLDTFLLVLPKNANIDIDMTMTLPDGKQVHSHSNITSDISYPSTEISLKHIDNDIYLQFEGNNDLLFKKC